MKHLFRTGTFGLMTTKKELLKLKLNNKNRGQEKGYDQKHVNNLIESYLNGSFKFYPTVWINQLGIIIDGSHRYQMSLELMEKGIVPVRVLYVVTTDDSLATNDQLTLDRVQVSMNNSKALKPWSNANFYKKAESDPKNYPLFSLLKHEVSIINNEVKNFTKGGMKINWVGGIVAENADALYGSKMFTDLEIFRNEILIKKVKSKQYKNDREHVITLLQILNKKGIDRAIRVVAYLMEKHWTEKKFNIEAAKVLLDGFDFKRNFKSDNVGNVMSEMERMFKEA